MKIRETYRGWVEKEDKESVRELKKKKWEANTWIKEEEDGGYAFEVLSRELFG